MNTHSWFTVAVRVLLWRIVHPLLKSIPRPKERRNILLVAHNSLMLRFLADFQEIFSPDQRLHFFLVLGPEGKPEDTIVDAMQIGKLRACSRIWDLVVAADHPNSRLLYDLLDRDRWPTLRIAHGGADKRAAGEVYAFGSGNFKENGRIRYSCIFVASESDRQMALKLNPAFREVVSVAGSPQDDVLLGMAGRREEIRRNIGVSPQDRLVFVLSTWGPHGLFNSMGDAFLSGARRLLHEFRFVLSVHPNDCRPRGSGQRVWGEYIRSQKQHGFMIREPYEDWMPYLVACDAIVTDHTSLALRGTLLRKPTLFVPIPDDLLKKGSPLWRLRAISPVLKPDASDLRDRLVEVFKRYPSQELVQIAGQINSCPGQSTERIQKKVYELLNLVPPIEPSPKAHRVQ